MRRNLFTLLLAAAMATLASAACGGGSNEEQPAGLKHDIHIHLDEWSVKSAPESIAGPATVNIGGHNHGQYPHQVTVVKTDLDPANLPISQLRVDVESLGGAVVSFDVPAADGDAGIQVASANVSPGKYVVYCAIPGHYQQGMYGSFEVTAAPSP